MVNWARLSFYFDDESWVVRYLVIETGVVETGLVETGGWPGGRPVLISPNSVSKVSRRDRLFHLTLTKKQAENRPETDAHLRGAEAVTGYHIEARDGEIGHVHGFLLDDETWAIRYVEVATRDWWPGRKVFVSPIWIEKASWMESKLYVGLSREAILSAPEYVESTRVDRRYEDQLHSHYGRPPYWLHEKCQQ